MEKQYDLVVFGATSFVGEILCRYLVERHGTDGTLRWAIAGRNEAKLEATAAATGADVPRIVADAGSADDMAALVADASVVVSTVGPYALYGNELVGAAAAAGTDYCDLSGESQWMRRMIDAHADTAEESGARIVHACGFDSIPSDMGVWFLQKHAIERFGVPCNRIAMRVRTIKGSASGGTIASMLNIVDEVKADPSIRKTLANPYSLAPEEHRSGVRQPNVTAPQRDEFSGQWIGPFVMAAVNTRVVHRSNALLGHAWGHDFVYDEATMMGDGPKGAVTAAGLSGGLGAFMLGAGVGPVRSLLEKRLPAPGEGPSPEEQLNGRFDLRFWGRTDDGEEIQAKVTGDRDPGYGSTAKMLGEAAVLLGERSAEDAPGGFHTPSTAFGDSLIDRLTEHAGLTFDVLP